jgi:formylglycine-generating enzyme required for sulfatase activity
MIVVPAGSFTMGSPESETDRSNNEGPQHQVTFAKQFAVGRFSVKRGEFAAFLKDTGEEIGDCAHGRPGGSNPQEGSWRNPGFEQDDRHPVVCLSWQLVDNGEPVCRLWLSRGANHCPLIFAHRGRIVKIGSR